MTLPPNELRILLIDDGEPSADSRGMSAIDAADRTGRRGLWAQTEAAAERAGCRSQVHIDRSAKSFSSGVDLIVVSQDHPTQRSPAWYRDYQQRFPLARWVTVCGPWCSGAFRTGYPNAMTAYVSRLAWPWQCENFIRRYFQQQATPWDPPATRSTTERLARGLPDVATSPPTVTVHMIAARSGVGLGWNDVAAGLQWSAITYDGIAQALESGPAGDPAAVWLWELDVPGLTPQRFCEGRRALGGHCLVVWGFAEILWESWAAALYQQAGPADLAPGLGATHFMAQPLLLWELQAAIRDLSLQDGRGANRFQPLHDVDDQ
jgi:hypothetical protein